MRDFAKAMPEVSDRVGNDAHKPWLSRPALIFTKFCVSYRWEGNLTHAPAMPASTLELCIHRKWARRGRTQGCSRLITNKGSENH